MSKVLSKGNSVTVTNLLGCHANNIYTGDLNSPMD